MDGGIIYWWGPRKRSRFGDGKMKKKVKLKGGWFSEFAQVPDAQGGGCWREVASVGESGISFTSDSGYLPPASRSLPREKTLNSAFPKGRNLICSI